MYFDENSVKGYYIPNYKEGFIFATNETAGIELLKMRMGSTDKAVIPLSNSCAVNFLQNIGFERTQVKGARMILDTPFKWQPQCIYNRLGGNFG